MELASEQLIPQSRHVVWNALNDPEILKVCISGCELVERTDPNRFRIIVAAAIGPVRARFTGHLEISDVVPDSSYKLSFEGAAGVAGFAKGTAAVQLVDASADTLLTYSVQAKVGGKIAQVGSRLIDSVARKLAQEFFGSFNEKVARPAGTAPETRAPAPVGWWTRFWLRARRLLGR
jgi:carbon monoxide dehydrogenase subunit G